MKHRQTLSIVLACKNEEANIPAFMENVSWADEIVVVDMLSTDNTLKLAKQYTDKVYKEDGGPLKLIPWNKNVGFEKATKDWILILDADERVTDQLRQSIERVLESPDADGYEIVFENYFFGKFLRYGGWTNSILRMFRRGSTRYELKIAHDHLKVDGTVRVLDGTIRHLSHPSIETFIRKMNLYTTQDATSIIKEGHGGLLNRSVGKVGAIQLLLLPIYMFFRHYIRMRGYKDGIHGLVVSLLMSFYIFLERAKVWESQLTDAQKDSFH